MPPERATDVSGCYDARDCHRRTAREIARLKWKTSILRVETIGLIVLCFTVINQLSMKNAKNKRRILHDWHTRRGDGVTASI